MLVFRQLHIFVIMFLQRCSGGIIFNQYPSYIQNLTYSIVQVCLPCYQTDCHWSLFFIVTRFNNSSLMDNNFLLTFGWTTYLLMHVWQEMMGLAYFISDQSKKEAEYCMENAFSTYMVCLYNPVFNLKQLYQPSVT